ncbi:thiamine biosynthesis lipoprotein [Arthrobacter sp. V4I6]|uniref:FAD:protein FMN transferase n=1 Tax=unclassified Arthrobacter TaxID=235627 RepID=UPI002787DBAA|nr:MULTISPECIES: FAD:protein FMN transferase [unclassified Arthrobacter]MDQ0820287.1 thiamine biosynthesis lipoprotein [Arthrobacter sp. V1I7]MDQ0854469.1 thiamine biosynthesis lipoprotein [Arthrobacter sp. V4I6]
MPHPGWTDFSFDGIGTRWQISTPSALSEGHRRRLLGVVADYDTAWSRFRPDSLVSRAARQPGNYEFPAEAAELGPLYGALYRLSNGAMTPLIGGSLAQLGYGAGYSLRPEGPPLAAPRWEDVLEWEGTVLTTRAPVVIDVGAAGKGQLADLLSAELLASGISDHFIDASGDLLNPGNAPVEVALEHPYDSSRAIGVVTLGAGALCASAANRRAWGDGLHHVLDGTTGAPVRTIVASWAMAGSAMLADALATALFFVEGARLREEFEFSWLAVYSDGHAEYSADFEGVLFS